MTMVKWVPCAILHRYTVACQWINRQSGQIQSRWACLDGWLLVWMDEWSMIVVYKYMCVCCWIAGIILLFQCYGRTMQKTLTTRTYLHVPFRWNRFHPQAKCRGAQNSFTFHRCRCRNEHTNYIHIHIHITHERQTPPSGGKLYFLRRLPRRLLLRLLLLPLLLLLKDIDFASPKYWTPTRCTSCPIIITPCSLCSFGSVHDATDIQIVYATIFTYMSGITIIIIYIRAVWLMASRWWCTQ